MNPNAYAAGEQLQQEYGLKVLRICTDPSGEQVLLNLSTANQGEVARLSLSSLELGVPGHEAGAEGDQVVADDRFALPDHVRGALRNAASFMEPQRAPLWLSLVRPFGLLAAVPWERLLHPLFDVPILRLPAHRLAPRSPQRDLDSVICFSSPAADAGLESELIETIVAHVPVNLAKRTTLHLFAGTTVQRQLVEIKERSGSDFRIEVYEPPPRAATRGSLPWLAWMKGSLRGRSADLVHFVCHSHRVRDQGALALAEAPDRDPGSHVASLIFALDLVEFLDDLGAWSVAFSSPPSNVSSAGMRMLQDQVARLRPGPVFLHDMTHPQAKEALAATYAFLYGEGFGPPHTSAISLFAHPVSAADVTHDETSDRLLNDYTLIGYLGEELKAANAPAWLASSQRILEATACEVAEAVESEGGTGKKRARDLVLRALADHARSGGGDGEPR